MSNKWREDNVLCVNTFLRDLDGKDGSCLSAVLSVISDNNQKLSVTGHFMHKDKWVRHKKSDLREAESILKNRFL